jgi:hypothetical protein
MSIIQYINEFHKILEIPEYLIIYCFLKEDSPALICCVATWAYVASFVGFEITLRHTSLRRTLYDGSAGRRDVYPTICNIHRRQIFVPSAGFEPPIPANEGPQSYALDDAATGIGR